MGKGFDDDIPFNIAGIYTRTDILECHVNARNAGLELRLNVNTPNALKYKAWLEALLRSLIPRSRKRLKKIKDLFEKFDKIDYKTNAGELFKIHIEIEEMIEVLKIFDREVGKTDEI